MIQHAPWSRFFKREIMRLYWSTRRQWNLWRMWKLDRNSEEFKTRLRANINLNRRTDKASGNYWDRTPETDATPGVPAKTLWQIKQCDL